MGCEKLVESLTIRERLLLGCIIVLFCVVFVLLTVLGINGDHEGTREKKSICNHPECVKAAVQIMDIVDSSKDPCGRFYEFSCGAFLKYPQKLTVLDDLENLSEKTLKQIVTGSGKYHENVPKSVEIQRRFYNSCTNTTDNEDVYFVNILKEIIGGWPVLEKDWDPRNFNWIDVMQRARNKGLPYKFFFDIDIVLDNNTYILQLSPPSTRWFSVLNDENSNRFTRLVSLWNSSLNLEEIKRELRTTMYFAIELTKLIKTADLSKTTISKLKNIRGNSIHWLHFLKNITNFDELIENNEIYTNGFEYYLEGLYELLRKTGKHIQANFVAISILSENINFLSENVRNIFRNSVTIIEGEQREQFCYKTSLELFPMVAQGEYFRNFVTADKIMYVENMVQELVKSMQSLTWMDGNTLKNVTIEIGWKESVRNPIQNYLEFHQLEFRSGALKMQFKMRNYLKDDYFKKLRHDYFVYNFFETKTTSVNAYYDNYLNVLRLPAPLIQGFVLNTARPNYMNYGSLGTIISTEICRLFINETNRFHNITKCFTDSEATGKICDYFGSEISYKTYQSYVKQTQSEDLLPGLNYTQSQIFWIMSSSSSCNGNELFSRNYVDKGISLIKDFYCPDRLLEHPATKCRMSL